MTQERLGDRVEQALGRRADVEPDLDREAPPGWNIRRTAFWLTLTGVSLYLVFPSLKSVLGEWDDVDSLAPVWLLVMLLLQAAATACLWALQRMSLHGDAWYPVISSQLASNALSKVAPGGGAIGSALQYKMLVQAGYERAPAVAGITASNLMTLGVVLALPVLAIPTIIGGGVDRSLIEATALGLGVFFVLFLLAYFVLAHNRPLARIGRVVQRVRNRLRRDSPPLTTLPDRLLRERDRILSTLGPRWKAALLATVGRWAFDYLSLLAALAAVGSTPRPSLVLLAFCAAQVLAQIPITPGGLGFVEAGLTAMLAFAGVSAGSAALATFAYRLFQYWLPLPLGLVGLALHRRRYPTSAETSSAQPQDSVKPLPP